VNAQPIKPLPYTKLDITLNQLLTAEEVNALMMLSSGKEGLQ